MSRTAWSKSRTVSAQTGHEEPYGPGFAVVYASKRYALFSRRLAKLALSLLAKHGASGSNLLDLACGSGSGSAVFARAGFHVIGIDRSRTMLDVAEQSARAEGVRLSLYQQDMQTFHVPFQVDVVACLFDSLNYLLEEQQLAATFRRVATALRPGGLFVFDMNTIHGLETRWGSGDRIATMRREFVELNQYHFDPTSRINSVTNTVFVREGDGPLFRRYTEVHRERGYAPEHVFGFLRDAGLDVLAAYGLGDDFQGLTLGLEPLSDDAGRMVVVAQRAARDTRRQEQDRYGSDESAEDQGR
jgi:SAM-dependent methyltransferase